MMTQPLQRASVLVASRTPLRSAIATLDAHPEYATVFVVDEEGKLVGGITNGDVYRAIFSGSSLETPVSQCCNTTPIALVQNDLASADAVRSKIKALLERKGTSLPIVTPNGEVTSVLTVTQLEAQLEGNASARYGQGKTILVVGGAGYLGIVLTNLLTEHGFRVRVLDIFAHNNFALYSVPRQNQIEIVRCDIRDIRNIVSALQGVYGVALLAAVVGDPAGQKNPKDTAEINYLAAKMIAECAKYAQVNRLVYASTCSVYGVGSDVSDEEAPLNPVSHYAKTKIAAEQGMLSIADADFAPTILRLSTLYGVSPRMRFDLVVNTLTLHAIANGRIKIFGGKQWRPLLHVEDAARAFVACFMANKSLIASRIFNVGSEQENYQIETLGNIVVDRFPGTVLEVNEKLEDARNYRVSFERIQNTLGYAVVHSVPKALDSIGDFVKQHSEDDLFSGRYFNHLLRYNPRMGLDPDVEGA